MYDAYSGRRLTPERTRLKTPKKSEDNSSEKAVSAFRSTVMGSCSAVAHSTMSLLNTVSGELAQREAENEALRSELQKQGFVKLSRVHL